MARLPYVELGAAPPPVRDALTALPPLNIFRMLGHASTALRPYLRLGRVILGDLQLDAGLRELAILQVARQSEAEYEWVHHVSIGREVGLTEAKIAALECGNLGDEEVFNEAERAVLTFTASVVSSPYCDDATFAAVQAVLSPREIVELLFTVGSYLMLARVMTVLQVDVEEPIGDRWVELSRSHPGTA